ncbi:JAB domain-containing protein [Bacillus pseudomycoides]|uniref:JAB domain-containing protein n=1 Tax=Bacillus pseudomycoides TaxID=64104 RepID=UPI000BEDF205|nr:JAB domain-containing protein [Bacillus pseudomycoides]PEB42246.1 DNA repair protein RadC [Bacillus pseudomycoides]PEM69329.1 DNA repair protein RadC [Bacillus pseudomycoides]PGA62205.1 DNA repair protein RadC [Bacillus pseudomycoides]
MENIYEIVRIEQVVMELEDERYVIHTTEDGAKVASKFIGDDDREVFFVMCLNTKNEVVVVHRCHVGALNASIVHPREVFKSAILNNCSSIITAHQHPSRSVQPSREDVEVTKNLVKAGEILGIEMLDQLIVNDRGEFYSIRDNRHLF